MTPDIVNLKSDIFLLFEEAKSRLETTYCDVSFSVTEDAQARFGKSYIHLSAYIKNAPLDLPDSLDLTVEFLESNSNMWNINADVYWTEFGLEDCFSRDPIALTVESATKLYNDLPRLVEIFEAAIQRKKPVGFKQNGQ